MYHTTPGPVPIILAMDHIVVHCKDDGIFFITGQYSSNTDLYEAAVHITILYFLEISNPVLPNLAPCLCIGNVLYLGIAVI